MTSNPLPRNASRTAAANTTRAKSGHAGVAPVGNDKGDARLLGPCRVPATREGEAYEDCYQMSAHH